MSHMLPILLKVNNISFVGSFGKVYKGRWLGKQVAIKK